MEEKKAILKFDENINAKLSHCKSFLWEDILFEKIKDERKRAELFTMYI